MYLTHLSLTDFRSYTTAEVGLDAGVTVFTGANGQGKTNLVEAVELLATLGSHRVATDTPLVRSGAERAVVRGRVKAGLDDSRQLLLELQVNPGRANRALLNRAPLKRPRDLLGALRVVVFAPDDLGIVKGEPSQRRRYLDELITQRWPRLAGVRADYDRVLRQRSMLLKSLAGRGQRALSEDVLLTLEVWDEQLARFGAEIVQARLVSLGELQQLLADAYTEITPTRNQAVASYRSSSLGELADEPSPGIEELADRLRRRMAERRSEEVARGQCLVGPHRDDLLLELSELPAKGYASHGESWSLALALRLAAFGLLRHDGVEPVLILDDVFAELDENRRRRLAGLVGSAEQVLVTAAVDADVPAELSGRRYAVTLGTVEPAA